MADNEQVIVFAGTYGSLHEAELDFQTIKDLHKEKLVGKYEAAVFTKQDDGSVKIVDTDKNSRKKGLKIGVAAGAVVGILFPPSLIAGALAGGGVGLLTSHFTKGLKRGEVKGARRVAGRRSGWDRLRGCGHPRSEHRPPADARVEDRYEAGRRQC